MFPATTRDDALHSWAAHAELPCECVYRRGRPKAPHFANRLVGHLRHAVRTAPERVRQPLRPCMASVSTRRHPFEVGGSSVGLVAIDVVGVHVGVRRLSQEGLSNQSMNVRRAAGIEVTQNNHQVTGLVGGCSEHLPPLVKASSLHAADAPHVADFIQGGVFRERDRTPNLVRKIGGGSTPRRRFGIAKLCFEALIGRQVGRLSEHREVLSHGVMRAGVQAPRPLHVTRNQAVASARSAERTRGR